MSEQNTPLLSVRNLHTSFFTDSGEVKAVNGISFDLEAGKTLFNMKSYKMTIWFDGEMIEGEFLYGQITNSLSIGGFNNIGAKDMSFSDGLFETVLVKNPETPVEFQRIITSLLTDDLTDDMIVFRKSSRVVIKSEEEIPWTVDGEYGGSFKTSRVSNIQKAVSIILKDKRPVLS